MYNAIFKTEAPKGIGAMVYAHLQSPRQAYLGEGTEAVNTAEAGFGAVSAPVLAAAFGQSGTAAKANSVRARDFLAEEGTEVTILIDNYSKYHVEVDQVPLEYGDISTGQAIYCKEPEECGEFEVLDGSDFRYGGAGYIIPSVHIQADEGSDDVNSGVFSVPIKLR